VDISSVDLVNGITTVETLQFGEAPSRARRIVRDGDTIISTVRTYLKAIAPIHEPPENMVVSTGFAVVRPLEWIDSRFLGYALQGTKFIGGVVANSSGVSYPAINPTSLVCLPVGYPTEKKEQQHIAAFLDWKTGQIDALMARKKGLLEKLKERRLAVITQAVTRGLNPAAPLRDSGIPWLGNVPKHWEVRRLRFLVHQIDQGWSPKASNVEAAEGELGVLKLSAVHAGKFVPSENKMLEEIPEGQSIQTPQRHDLLVTRANTPELVGDACPVSVDFPELIIPDLIYRLKVDLGMSEERFVSYFLLSKQGRAQIESNARGSSGSMVKLGQGHLKNFQIPSPPQKEQREISDYVDDQIEKIEVMMEAVNEAIARLTEYRTALITAATTGKIDVRGVKVPNIAA
jgi:type I restriction enzyme S subunit